MALEKIKMIKYLRWIFLDQFLYTRKNAYVLMINEKNILCQLHVEKRRKWYIWFILDKEEMAVTISGQYCLGCATLLRYHETETGPHIHICSMISWSMDEYVMNTFLWEN